MSLRIRSRLEGFGHVSKDSVTSMRKRGHSYCVFLDSQQVTVFLQEMTVLKYSVTSRSILPRLE